MKITLEFILLRSFLILQANIYALLRFYSAGKNEQNSAKGQMKINHNIISQLRKQKTDASCSVATVATVVNAAQGLFRTKPSPVSQENILGRVSAENWKERVSKEGYRNRRGLTFRKLVRIVETTMDEFEIPVKKITAVALSHTIKHRAAKKRELASLLKTHAGNPNVMFIAHFNQGACFNTWHLPHISPLGGIHENGQEVLVADVDRDVKKPYRVSLDTFFSAMGWRYIGPIRKRGYHEGGYIIIEISEN